MNSQGKIAVSAGCLALLALGIAGSGWLHRPDSSTGDEAPKLRATGSHESVAEDRRRGESNPCPELSARYGESRTRQALAASRQNAALARDIVAATFSSEHAERQERMTRFYFEELGKKLDLRPDQLERLDAFRDKYEKSRREIATELVQRVDEHSQEVAEAYLSEDAFARGEISREEFDTVHARAQELVSAGRFNGLDPGELVMERDKGYQNPLRDVPEMESEFSALLDPGQAERYRAIQQESAPLAGPVEPRRLEAISDHVAGVGKIVEAMRMLDRP